MSAASIRPEGLPQVDRAAVDAWETFFKTDLDLKARIGAAAAGHGPSRVTFDFFDLSRANTALADRLLSEPSESLTYATRALERIDAPDLVGERRTVVAAPVNLPETHRVGVRDIRDEHRGQLVAVHGLVKRATSVTFRLLEAIYQCHGCHNFVRVPQDEHMVLSKPIECYEDQGGCGKDVGFRLIVDKTRGHDSRFVNHQLADLQEPPEDVRGGQQRKLRVYLENDLCDTLRVGRRAVVNGILRAYIPQGKTETPIAQIYLDVASVETDDEDDGGECSPDEEKTIRDEARREDVHARVANSLAPTLYGLEDEKLGIILQLFGSVEKHPPGGDRMRGESHVLLVGDPGVAKSRLLARACLIAPRSVKTSGKGSSSAGLTAAVVPDTSPGAESRFGLEAGAMVLADRGLLGIDELDKMDAADQSAMHEAMESGMVSINKAGITTSLTARCSILAAANPKHSRFSDYQTPAEQLDLPASLISRFDLIFILKDRPDKARDRELASRILDAHDAGARHTRGEAVDHEDVLRAPYSPDFLRKWIGLAKRCTPTTSVEARCTIMEWWESVRASTKPNEGEGVAITARQLEAARRLSEAAARIRLSDTISKADAELAVGLMERMLRRLASNDDGKLDIDRAYGAESHEQQKAVLLVENIVKQNRTHTDHGAPHDLVVDEAARLAIPRERAETILRKLQETGSIWQPKEGHYKKLQR